MKSLTARMILITMMVFCLSSLSFAAQSKTITVTAAVPTISGGLNVTVSKIQASDGTWLVSDPDLSIDFGTLTRDTTFNIFKSLYYYAVDIGVTDNTGTVWTITHTRNSIQKDAINNLDGNVNVTFMQQTNSSTATQLQKLSFANSNNVAYTKTQLGSGWLRIYYGIGTGATGASGDAPGVTPIGVDKPAGTYTGSVVITLTP